MPDGQNVVEVALPYGWTRTYDRPTCVDQSKVATFSCMLDSCVKDRAALSSQCCPRLTCYNGGQQRSKNACQCTCPEGRHTGLYCNVTSDLVYANLLMNLSSAFNATEEWRIRTGVATFLSLTANDVYVNLVHLVSGRRSTNVPQYTYQIDLRVVGSSYENVQKIYTALRVLRVSDVSWTFGSLSSLSYIVSCNESTWCCSDSIRCPACALTCCLPCVVPSNTSQAPSSQQVDGMIPREPNRPAFAYYWIAIIIVVVVLTSYCFAYRKNPSFRAALSELWQGVKAILKFFVTHCASLKGRKKSQARPEFIQFSPRPTTTVGLDGKRKVDSSDSTLLASEEQEHTSAGTIPGVFEGPMIVTASTTGTNKSAEAPESRRQPVMGYNLYYRQASAREMLMTAGGLIVVQTSMRRERGKVVMEQVNHVVTSQVEFASMEDRRAPAEQSTTRPEHQDGATAQDEESVEEAIERRNRTAEVQLRRAAVRQGSLLVGEGAGRGMKLWEGSFEAHLNRLREEGRGDRSKLVSRGYFKAVQKYEPDQNVLNKFLVQQAAHQGDESAPSTSRSHRRPEEEIDEDKPSMPSTRVEDVRAEKFTSSQWEYDPSEKHRGLVSL